MTAKKNLLTGFIFRNLWLVVSFERSFYLGLPLVFSLLLLIHGLTGDKNERKQVQGVRDSYYCCKRLDLQDLSPLFYSISPFYFISLQALASVETEIFFSSWFPSLSLIPVLKGTETVKRFFFFHVLTMQDSIYLFFLVTEEK